MAKTTKSPARKAVRKPTVDDPSVKASKSVKGEETSASFNLREMSQSHGALPSRTMSKYLTGYDTSDASEYVEKLTKMENSELHDHAVLFGEVPIDDRKRLIDRLHVRFLEVRAAGMPRTQGQNSMTPEGKAFLKKFMAGEI